MMLNKRKALVAVVVVSMALGATFAAWHWVGVQRHAVRQTLCVHNLKFLAMSLEAYAGDHDGRYPDRLSALWPEYIVNLADLICPEIQVVCLRERGVAHPFPENPAPDVIEALSSYAYVPGHTTADAGASDILVAYEKVDNHFGKGRSLLYLDGHGAWEPPENWRGNSPNRDLPAAF